MNLFDLIKPNTNLLNDFPNLKFVFLIRVPLNQFAVQVAVAVVPKEFANQVETGCQMIPMCIHGVWLRKGCFDCRATGELLLLGAKHIFTDAHGLKTSNISRSMCRASALCKCIQDG